MGALAPAAAPPVPGFLDLVALAGFRLLLAYAPTRYGPYLSSGVFLTFNLSFPDLLLDVDAASSCVSCLGSFADAGFPLTAPGGFPY